MSDALVILLCAGFYALGYAHATVIDARRNLRFMREWLAARGDGAEA
jgi:hypothetical protein